MRVLLLLLSITVCFAYPAPARSDVEHNPVAREPRPASVSQALGVIVKLRKEAEGAVLQKVSGGQERTRILARRTGLTLSLRREISETLMANIIELRGVDAGEALARLRSDPAIAYAALDRRRYAHATTPNDSRFTGQWYLRNTEVAAVNAIDAWDREVGSNGVVIAVLDTGVLYDHPDLGRADRGGKLLPGHDFVSQTHQTNDGDARDANPSDPGDWVNAADKTSSVYDNCETSDSSWHGTRVAGVIGAMTNNSTGIAGLAWNSYLLPVRVLGKCGGIDSDILAGMRWAAGLPVPGVPANPTPARILNASLGSEGACEPSYREVIEELTARKVLLVISAGNEASQVSSPANCPGVAAVAAIRHAGSKVGFSNLGPEVTLAAPGGNCVNIDGGPCLFSLDTTSNDGTTSPGNHIFTDQVRSNLGTSFSAPIVSGVAALMLSRNGNLSTHQMLERLRESARPFPVSIADAPDAPVCRVPADAQDVQLAQCICTTSTCGAGMVDAARGVESAERPIAAIAVPAVSAGQNLTLNASGSAAACGRSVSGYAWSVVTPTMDPPVILGADTAAATVIAPVAGAFTLRLTVTDSANRTDSVTVLVESNRATTSAPAQAGSSACTPAIVPGATPGSTSGGSSSGTGSTSSSGGGGGSFGLLSLMLLGLIPRIRRCI